MNENLQSIKLYCGIFLRLCCETFQHFWADIQLCAFLTAQKKKTHQSTDALVRQGCQVCIKNKQKKKQQNNNNSSGSVKKNKRNDSSSCAVNTRSDHKLVAQKWARIYIDTKQAH